jgi:hypothetical protein
MQTIRDIADTLLAETPEEAAKSLADAEASFAAFRAAVQADDLRSLDLPRNSGEVAAVNGPTTVDGESTDHEPT